MLIRVFVKIIKNSKNKYGYEAGIPVLERVIGKKSPGDYGMIKNAYSPGGLGCLILTNEPAIPCSIVPAKPIGSITFEFENVVDNEIIAVSQHKRIKDITQLSKQKLNKITGFIKYLKWIETGKRVKIRSINDKAKTEKIIKRAIELYRRVGE